jgi:hypothetical protein
METRGDAESRRAEQVKGANIRVAASRGEGWEYRRHGLPVVVIMHGVRISAPRVGAVRRR